MSDFTHKEVEHFSRQQTAERLRDLADALDTRGTCEFTIDGEQISIPVGDGVRVRRKLKAKGDQITLELELIWSTAHVSKAVPQTSSGA
jgi:amphi-Trp domain-containing protein